MGSLIERTIKTLFHGVSRQPAPVRLPGQVEDALNVSFSVETGGFSKRYGSRHIKEITSIGPSEDVRFHVINRDADEKYAVIASEDTLQVFDMDGNEKTINPYPPSVASYLGTNPADLRFVTVADHTFVLNTKKVVQMASSPVGPAQQHHAVVYVKGSYMSSNGGVWSLYLNDTLAAQEAAGSGGRDTTEIAKAFYDDLIVAYPTDWTFDLQGSFVFIRRNDGGPFTIRAEDPNGDRDIEVTYLNVRKTDELPARAYNGQVVRVVSDSTSKGDYWVKFETYDNSNIGRGQWIETATPGRKMAFNAETMPHALIRESNGTFTLTPFTWDQRKVGTELAVPDHDFVGRTISDIVLHRNRLWFLSDETAFASRDKEYFNFFPEKSIDVLDTDPFGLTASTNKVSILKAAVPFQKTLFLTADEAQFEVSGDILSPNKAAIDLTTNYTVTGSCRPEVLGNALYLAASDGDNAAVLEYILDQDTLTNVAADVLKHAKGFVKGPLRRMTGDPLSGTLFSLTSRDLSTIYTYSVFYNGNEKVQSAWGRWCVDGEVLDIAFIDGFLLILIRRDGVTFFEKITVGIQDYDGWRFVPRMDREVRVQGTYDAETNLTTWTLPYASEGVVGLTGWGFEEEYMRLRGIVIETDGTTVTAFGDWSEGECLFGYPFPSKVTLSGIYERDATGMAILSGRLILKKMVIHYQDSGSFAVVVRPRQRASRRYEFLGNVIGTYVPGRDGIRTGIFKVNPSGRGDETVIEIVNDTIMPHTITSIAWTGFFNEISRQE